MSDSIQEMGRKLRELRDAGKLQSYCASTHCNMVVPFGTSKCSICDGTAPRDERGFVIWQTQITFPERVGDGTWQ